MISREAGRAVQLISGIELCKETAGLFWQQMAARIVMDLDAAGADVKPAADLLAQMWDDLPDRQAEEPAATRLAKIARSHYLVGPGFGHCGGFCSGCGKPWPCETRNLADGTRQPSEEGSPA